VTSTLPVASAVCERCNGTGLKYCERSRVKCPECGGAKTVPVRTYGQYRCQVCRTYGVPLWLFCGTCNRDPVARDVDMAVGT
jgi:DnaJ-class molecular chaperone